MLSKTISSAALGMLGGLGSSTNNTPTVNNNITINTTPTDEKFIEPSPYEPVEPSAVNPQFIDLFNRLCINLLTVNDYKLLVNIVDQSKRIIFCSADLKILISVFIGCKVDDVTINLLPLDVSSGCLCKNIPSMYQDVENIKIKERDFKLMYNTAFNTLKDVYHVCMDRVIA